MKDLQEIQCLFSVFLCHKLHNWCMVTSKVVK